MIEATIQDYKIYNSAIESSIIPKTKHLPQLEQPDAVMDAIHMFFCLKKDNAYAYRGAFFRHRTNFL